MRAFINEFRTTNELLFKERNNSLSELRFEVHELLRVIANALISNYEVKGVTTRGGKTTTQDIQNDNTNMHTEEPLVVNHDKPVEPKEVLVVNQHQKTNEPVVQPSTEVLSRITEQAAIKGKDLGSFTIPYIIGELHINNALADLGASISLIPYTMYEKLGLGEPKPTRMSLELADRSIQYPRRIIENVLIQVDKFILPINFVILDMPEDSRVPIILGRPFWQLPEL
ncbi:vacuolar-sorting receptor 1-like protein [Tanacetum coccineum]